MVWRKEGNVVGYARELLVTDDRIGSAHLGGDLGRQLGGIAAADEERGHTDVPPISPVVRARWERTVALRVSRSASH